MPDPFAAYAVSDDPFAEFVSASSMPSKTTFADEPTDYWSGVRKSAGDTIKRTIKGVVRGAASPVLHPIDTIKSPFLLAKDLAGGGHGTADMLREIASGNPDVGGEAIGGLLLAKFGPTLASAAARNVPGLSRIAAAGLSGAVEKSPIVGPMGRGAIDAMRARSAALATEAAAPERAITGFERYGAQDSAPSVARDFAPAADVERFRSVPTPPRGANLVKSPTGLSDDLAKLLDELRSSGDLPESIGGSAKGLPSNVGPFDSRIASMDPMATIPGMEASVIDKAGTSVIRQKAAPYVHPAARTGTPLSPELERALINALRYGKQEARR